MNGHAAAERVVTELASRQVRLFARAVGVHGHLLTAVRLAAELIPELTFDGISLESRREDGSRYVAIWASTSLPVEAAVVAYGEYVRALVEAVPWPERDFLSLFHSARVDAASTGDRERLNEPDCIASAAAAQRRLRSGVWIGQAVTHETTARQGLSEPELLKAHALWEAVYARHAAGCCLHVVLDDANLSDGSVRACLNGAETAGCAECVGLSRLLLRMSRTQRGKLSRGGYAGLALELGRRPRPGTKGRDARNGDDA